MTHQMNGAANDLNVHDQSIGHVPLQLDQLPEDRMAVITKIADDLGMEPADVLAWAVDLLTRYVAAGGEP